MQTWVRIFVIVPMQAYCTRLSHFVLSLLYANEMEPPKGAQFLAPLHSCLYINILGVIASRDWCLSFWTSFKNNKPHATLWDLRSTPPQKFSHLHHKSLLSPKYKARGKPLNSICYVVVEGQNYDASSALAKVMRPEEMKRFFRLANLSLSYMRQPSQRKSKLLKFVFRERSGVKPSLPFVEIRTAQLDSHS